MKYDFNVSSLLQPIKKLFNEGVEEFLERIEKEIGFVKNPPYSISSVSRTKTLQRDENGIINKVTYYRSEEGNHTGSFVFIPKWNGKFDLEYFDANKNSRKKEDIGVTSFIGNIQGETIQDLKAFWSNLENGKTVVME